MMSHLPTYTSPVAHGYVHVPPANQLPLQNGYGGVVGVPDPTEYPEELCRLPGCGQLVHVDEDGEPSAYCSMRHCE